MEKSFKQAWTESLGVTEHNGEAFCVLVKVFCVVHEVSDSTLTSTMKVKLDEIERKEFLEGKLKKYHSEYLSFCNNLS